MDCLLALLEDAPFWELAWLAKALNSAASQDHSPAVAQLLQFAMDCGYHIADDSDNSSLVDAPRGSHLEVVRQLLDLHQLCSIYCGDARDEDQTSSIVNAKGGAALVGAAGRGHFPVVQEFLAAGTALGSCSGRLEALIAASQGGHHFILRELLRHRKIEYLVPSLTEEPGLTQLASPLLYHQGIVSLEAAYRENKQVLIEILLVDVNAILRDEIFSPLRKTVLRNEILALESMIDAGADLRNHGSKTLIMACTFNRIDCVRKLGVNVNSYDEQEGLTPVERYPLGAAIQHADCDVLVALLNSGADVNAKLVQHSNETALHYACSTMQGQIFIPVTCMAGQH
ncbi:ankyrin repeat-containing domain protein [Tirmania nivea]|nr:ankyrin repeat-containing domain protein [Tirmania nivea]